MSIVNVKDNYHRKVLIYKTDGHSQYMIDSYHSKVCHTAYDGQAQYEGQLS